MASLLCRTRWRTGHIPSAQSKSRSAFLPLAKHNASWVTFLVGMVLLGFGGPSLVHRASAQAQSSTINAESDAGPAGDLVQRLRRGTNPAVDPVEFQASAVSKLQLVRSGINRCIDELQGVGGASAILGSLRDYPGRLDLLSPKIVAELQKAAGPGAALDQADLELCARAVDTHAQLVPLGDPENRLTEVGMSLDRCVAALQRVGPNATATTILKRSGRKLGEDTYTTASTLRNLEGAVGSLNLSPQDLEICVSSYSTQSIQENRVAAAQPVTQQNQVGGFDCQSGYFACFGTTPYPICCPSGSSYCSQTCAGGSGGSTCMPWCESSCFPAEAMVSLEGGDTKPMREVEVGDRVRVLRDDGSVGYEDVYLLTHKDATTASHYVTLTLVSGAKLTLSPRHFIPTAPDAAAADWSRRLIKGADEIRVGDVVWYEAGSRPQAAEVTAVASSLALGAYNPLTLSGTIIVDGVVASAHSDWFLDGVVSADLQARVYQAVLAPVRLAYRVIGPAWTRRISEEWGVADAIRDATTRPRVAWLAWLVPLLLLPLVGTMLLRRRTR
jgi:hypothetical protein